MKVILVAHGALGIEMKNSMEMIYGTVKNIETIEFKKNDGLETLEKKIINTIGESEECLIFTDLFCGTPYNASCAVAMKNQNKNIEVISGMSLPLVLEAVTLMQNTELLELVDYLINVSHQVVQSFSKQKIEEEEDF